LVFDFGGSSDGFASTASAGGVPVGFLPGGALSGIENAYLSYTGFKPFGGTLAIVGGYMELPYTLGEATSSNDILFMERGLLPSHREHHRSRRFPFGIRRALFNDIFQDLLPFEERPLPVIFAVEL